MEAAYKAAANFPASERYGLSDQLRRAAQSIALNIAEGYGRCHYLDKLRFFYTARGSMCETLSGFILAHKVGYIDDKQLSWVRDDVEAEAEKALNGYIAFIRKKKLGSEEFGLRLIREDDQIYELWTNEPHGEEDS